MILYMDREEIPDVEAIRPEVLRYVVEQAERANGRFDRLHRYYRGDHDNLRRGQPEQDEVRVAVNYAKYVVDITLGYYLGDPVKYDANDTHDMESGPEIDLKDLLNCYDNQQISEVDSRVGKGMGVFGECLELCYASSDADPEPRSAYIDPAVGCWWRIPRWSTTSCSRWCGKSGKRSLTKSIISSPSTLTEPKRTTPPPT